MSPPRQSKRVRSLNVEQACPLTEHTERLFRPPFVRAFRDREHAQYRGLSPDHAYLYTK